MRDLRNIPIKPGDHVILNSNRVLVLHWVFHIAPDFVDTCPVGHRPSVRNNIQRSGHRVLRVPTVLNDLAAPHTAESGSFSLDILGERIFVGSRVAIAFEGWRVVFGRATSLGKSNTVSVGGVCSEADTQSYRIPSLPEHLDGVMEI